MRRVFLSHSFAERDRALVTHVESLLRSHALVAITGRNLGGGQLTPEVARLIEGSDAMVALFTQRQNEPPGVTHPWVLQEFGHARLRGMPAIGMYETGVPPRRRIPGPSTSTMPRLTRCPALSVFPRRSASGSGPRAPAEGDGHAHRCGAVIGGEGRSTPVRVPIPDSGRGHRMAGGESPPGDRWRVRRSPRPTRSRPCRSGWTVHRRSRPLTRRFGPRCT